ncbi:MAG: hypothetical protein AAF485_27220, partial [Chloroflexota bacterium]
HCAFGMIAIPAQLAPAILFSTPCQKVHRQPRLSFRETLQDKSKGYFLLDNKIINVDSSVSLIGVAKLVSERRQQCFSYPML